VTEPGFELGTDGPRLIAVGVDGSRTSMRAASYAAGLARRQGSELACIYVKKVGGASGLVAGAAMAMVITSDEIAEGLRREIEERAASVGVTVSLHVSTGDPYLEIRRIADELRADALVVGASESAGHRIIGSLATRLVKAGRWPVTVVP